MYLKTCVTIILVADGSPTTTMTATIAALRVLSLEAGSMNFRILSHSLKSLVYAKFSRRAQPLGNRGEIKRRLGDADLAILTTQLFLGNENTVDRLE
jgi:hypothetical protein